MYIADRLLDHIPAQAILEFAKWKINKNWTTVIFSDEKTFCIQSDLKPTLSMYNKICYLQEHNQAKKTKACYWGWMSSAGPRE